MLISESVNCSDRAPEEIPTQSAYSHYLEIYENAPHQHSAGEDRLPTASEQDRTSRQHSASGMDADSKPPTVEQ